ncbi:MAG: hypothetical protein LOD94_14015 [Gammaproteobacteria bacterium]
MWSKHIIVKYFALQLVGWLLVLGGLWFAAEIFAWPKHFVWIGLAVWMAKDVALYPFLWRAYDERSAPTAYPRQGEEGVVLDRLDPIGSVRVGGERWRARAHAHDSTNPRIEAGERVRIVACEGMTLLVERADAGRSNEDERRNA